MKKSCGGIKAELFFTKRKSQKPNLNVFVCFDKVEVEHIRQGKVIYSDEEK